MKSRNGALPVAGSGVGTNRFALLAVCVMALVVTGCGAKKDKSATQTAAKVNKEEITVHQINFVLQQQRGVPPAQAASASQQVLERLIDQELALQKARDQNIDRDPSVVQQIEAAKREIIARTYVERVGSGATKPGPAEIKKYYDDKPALFKDRRIYTIQELRIEAKPAQLDELNAKLQSSASIDEFIAFLKSQDFKHVTNRATLPAEQLPLGSLDALAGMKDGQATLKPAPAGAQVLVMLGSRSQPVDEAQASAAIEAFLLNERRRKIIEDDLKALRSAAKIQYLGDYAKGEAAPATAP